MAALLPAPSAYSCGFDQIVTFSKASSFFLYEGQAVNRPQIDIKHKVCGIRTRKIVYFSTYTSNNIDTSVPSLYQCTENRSTQVFWLLSQPLPHLHFQLFVISDTCATRLWTALSDKHFAS
jgi:hypothetical protein